jgi:(heptosyl)LPS beta-1,4-glucosyltransferase
MDEGSADAYFIARKNIVFDKWIEHTGWWPDYQFRFFKSGTVTWPEEIHAQPKVTGTMVQLEAREEYAITHHNYQTIEQFLDRMNRYTSIEVDRGQQTSDKKTEDLVNIPAAFSSEFARRFFADEGYLDGTHGLALSYLQSMYQVVVELKRWQKAGFPETNASSLDVERLRNALRDLQYWTTSYSIQRTTGLQRLIWTIKRKFR